MPRQKVHPSLEGLNAKDFVWPMNPAGNHQKQQQLLRELGVQNRGIPSDTYIFNTTRHEEMSSHPQSSSNNAVANALQQHLPHALNVAGQNNRKNANSEADMKPSNAKKRRNTKNEAANVSMAEMYQRQMNDASSIGYNNLSLDAGALQAASCAVRNTRNKIVSPVRVYPDANDMYYQWLHSACNSPSPQHSQGDELPKLAQGGGVSIDPSAVGFPRQMPGLPRSTTDLFMPFTGATAAPMQRGRNFADSVSNWNITDADVSSYRAVVGHVSPRTFPLLGSAVSRNTNQHLNDGNSRNDMRGGVAMSRSSGPSPQSIVDKAEEVRSSQPAQLQKPAISRSNCRRFTETVNRLIRFQRSAQLTNEQCEKMITDMFESAAKAHTDIKLQRGQYLARGKMIIRIVLELAYIHSKPTPQAVVTPPTNPTNNNTNNSTTNAASTNNNNNNANSTNAADITPVVLKPEGVILPEAFFRRITDPSTKFFPKEIALQQTTLGENDFSALQRIILVLDEGQGDISKADLEALSIDTLYTGGYKWNLVA